MGNKYYPLNNIVNGTYTPKMSLLEVRQQMALVAMGLKTNSQVCADFDIMPNTWNDYRARMGKYGRLYGKLDGTRVRSKSRYEKTIFPPRPKRKDGTMEPMPRVATEELHRAIKGVDVPMYGSTRMVKSEGGKPGKRNTKKATKKLVEPNAPTDGQ